MRALNIKLQLCFQLAEVKRGANTRVLNQLNGKTKNASLDAFHATSMVHFTQNVDEHIPETSDSSFVFSETERFSKPELSEGIFCFENRKDRGNLPPPHPTERPSPFLGSDRWFGVVVFSPALRIKPTARAQTKQGSIAFTSVLRRKILLVRCCLFFLRRSERGITLPVTMLIRLRSYSTPTFCKVGYCLDCPIGGLVQWMIL